MRIEITADEHTMALGGVEPIITTTTHTSVLVEAGALVQPMARRAADAALAVLKATPDCRKGEECGVEIEKMERLVRDAILGYEEMYPSAPNDDAEDELCDRAAVGNQWLRAHGLKEQPFQFKKHETEDKK